MLRRKFLLAVVVAFLGVVACRTQTETPPDPAASTPAPVADAAPIVLNGTGATFPLYLYQRWFQEYNRLHPNVRTNYQPVGSAAGIRQTIAETVDFGASDVAMSDAEMAQVKRGVVLLPMAAGSVAIAYNLPNVAGELKLSRAALSGIFLGEIDRWNDEAIAALNPDLALPDRAIVLIHRSDGSGTTATLTAHLSAISDTWRETIGSGVNVSWPAGIGTKSNAGVSAQIQQLEGAIGYVELSYAQRLGLPIASLENKAGQFVPPSIETAAAALAGVELPDDLRAFVADPEAEGAYPIATYTWILAYENYDDPEKASALKALLQWCLTEGQRLGPELGYVPLPPEVAERAIAAVEKISP